MRWLLNLLLPIGLAVHATAQEQGTSTPPAWNPSSAWVKLCQTPASASTDMFSKERPVGKETCYTHHERLDGSTAKVLVAVAVRQTAGQRKQFTVLVPVGMQQQGIRAYFLPTDVWQKVQKSQRIEKSDELRLKSVDLNKAFCHATGCTGEIGATPQLISDLMSNAGLMVFAISGLGQPVAFPVPLRGFREAYEGAPVDSVKYEQARRALMQRIIDQYKSLNPPRQ